MRPPRPVTVLLASAFLLPPAAPAAADPEPAPAAAAPAQPPDGAAGHHAALLRDPRPGPPLDRFCEAWLAELDTDSLEAFLTRRAADGSTEDRLALGFYLAREGRDADAVRVLRAALRGEDGHAGARLFKARIEASTLDFDTALADLQAAAPGTDPALAAELAELRGRLLARAGRPAEALAAWEPLLRDPDAETLEALVALQVREGMLGAAIGTLDRLIEATADPRERAAQRIRRGDLQRGAGDADAALRTYEGVLAGVAAGGPLERLTLDRVEEVHRRARDAAGLAERLAALEEAHPERVEVTHRRARVLAELGRTQDSLRTWRGLLERAPGDRDLRAAGAEALAEAGETDGAVAALEALRDDQPGDAATRLRLAGLHARAGRPAKAEAEVVATLDGSDAAARRAVRALERLGLGDAAERLARARGGVRQVSHFAPAVLRVPGCSRGGYTASATSG